jgi:hypothetical protein
MISVNVDVPADDVARLGARLGQYVAFLKGNTPKAVEAVSVQMVKSLRKATKQKPAIKSRTVVPNPKFNTRLKKKGRAAQKAKISQWYEANAPEKNHVLLDPNSGILGARWAVERIKRGKRIQMPVFASGKAAAVASRLRKMNKSGLAANTWTWILGKLSTSPGVPASKATAKGAVVNVAKVNNDQEYSVTLTNSLPYIRPNTDVRTAISKVDSWLRGRMEAALQKAKASAGLG